MATFRRRDFFRKKGKCYSNRACFHYHSAKLFHFHFTIISQGGFLQNYLVWLSSSVAKVYTHTLRLVYVFLAIVIFLLFFRKEKKWDTHESAANITSNERSDIKCKMRNCCHFDAAHLSCRLEYHSRIYQLLRSKNLICYHLLSLLFVLSWELLSDCEWLGRMQMLQFFLPCLFLINFLSWSKLFADFICVS